MKDSATLFNNRATFSTIFCFISLLICIGNSYWIWGSSVCWRAVWPIAIPGSKMIDCNTPEGGPRRISLRVNQTHHLIFKGPITIEVIRLRSEEHTSELQSRLPL